MLSSFRRKQTVLRVTGGDYDNDGMWHPGAEEEFSIMASVQPLNQNEKAQYSDQRPAGASNFNAVKIYSDTPLRCKRQALPDGTPMQEADILLWQGRRWQVAQVESWQSGVINHYRMVAWEVEPCETSNEEVSP